MLRFNSFSIWVPSWLLSFYKDSYSCIEMSSRCRHSFLDSIYEYFALTTFQISCYSYESFSLYCSIFSSNRLHPSRCYFNLWISSYFDEHLKEYVWGFNSLALDSQENRSWGIRSSSLSSVLDVLCRLLKKPVEQSHEWMEENSPSLIDQSWSPMGFSMKRCAL